MSRTPFRFDWIGVLVVCVTSARAQQVGHLTLREAMLSALKGRPELVAARSQVDASAARLRQARSGTLPNIILQGVATDGPAGAPTFGPLENPAILGTNPMSLEGLAADPLKKQFGAGITINQPLFDFGRTAHLSAAKSNLVQASIQDAETQAASVLLEVQRSYFEVLHRKSILNVREQDQIQRRSTLEQARAFVEAQIRSGVDLQTALANESESKSQLLAAQNDLLIAYAQLNHDMGSTTLSTPELDSIKRDSRPIDLPTSSEEALDMALKHRPEVLSLEKQSLAASQMIKGIRNELLPRLDFIGSVGALRPSSLITTDKNYAVGVALSIPIFTGGYVEGRLSEERSKKNLVDAQAKALIEGVKLQATKTWLDERTARSQVETRKIQKVAADKALELASERYRLKLSSLVELNEAESLAVRAAEQLASAEFALEIANSNLAWATGSTLKDFAHEVHQALGRTP